jgi:hypothetical protein
LRKVVAYVVYSLQIASQLFLPDTTRKATNQPTSKGSPDGAAQWIEAIKIAQQLLQVTGSVDNATALLKAVSG